MNSAATVPGGDATVTVIHLTGRVQGVGMRPALLRLARRHRLGGEVFNRRDAVMLRLGGDQSAIDRFVAALPQAIPAGASIDDVQIRIEPQTQPLPDGFVIGADANGDATRLDSVAVTPDRATCPTCLAETGDPHDRRYRYALNSCAECGPRFSMQQCLPWARHATSMAGFPLCADCNHEYVDADDRRLHAQSIACHVCGPAVHLERLDERAFSLEALTSLDELDAVATLIRQGEIVAIQGVGGFHLACDATNEKTVALLRARKQRPAKPLALLARDSDVIRRYAELNASAEALLASPEAPIVLLRRHVGGADAGLEGVAPGLAEIGFMLPSTALHHLLTQRLDRPVVLTSANRSGNPQCRTLQEARRDLADIADWLLWHDRDIRHRVDDSVVRIVMDEVRVLRGGRGYAPASIPLPGGFAAAPRVLALGGHLKNSLCLLQGSRAVLSPYVGDQDAPAMREAHQQMRQTMQELYGFEPQILASDLHPDYASTAEGQRISAGRPLVAVQHHHAHAAACLAENGHALEGGAVLAVVLDGLGYGENGELWGGEFLLADYSRSQRVAALRATPLPGGDAAARQPWRNLYAQLRSSIGWKAFVDRHGDLPLCQSLAALPLARIEQMIATGQRAPLASSAGRLFDAVACALGLPDRPMDESLSYEGEAAMQLEALATAGSPGKPYALDMTKQDGLPRLDPAPIWPELLEDLRSGRPRPDIALAFHAGLARAIAAVAGQLHASRSDWRNRSVVLSGGVFQNAVLLRLTVQHLEEAGFSVLTHRRVPASDAGLALGQAVVAAARVMEGGF